MDDKYKLYQQKVQAKLREIAAKIDELKAKSNLANVDAQMEINRRIEKFRSDKARIQSRLAEMKSVGEKAFGDLKEGTDRALSDLKAAIESAFDRFRKR